MTQKESLHEIISTLINRKAEGVYWDFKRKHHESNEKLIHDILCLANAKHSGDRFFIFGVDNEDFSLHPITNDDKRKTQANFADLFRANANKFFQSRFPEFYLQEMTIDGALIDVLVIKDTSDKPYYLVKKCHNLPSHHIYSRVCDTNTPINQTAQPHEIERMWRERFGLDMPPLERVKRYLGEPQTWSLLSRRDGCNGDFYYTEFPEFTLRVTDADHIACHEEWTRGEIRSDNNHAGYYELHYHQTLLDRIHYVSFDDHKKSMVAPTWEQRGAGRFYYYEADSINYAVQNFYSALFGSDDSLTLSISGEGEASNAARSRWGHYMKIPVLRTGEAESFLGPSDDREKVRVSSDDDEQYQLFLRNQLDFDDWRSRPGLPILLPENNNCDANWDTDFIISNAKSLQRVVKELDRNESKSPQSDQLLFSGVFLASPILLTFAIEIALKAWLFREQNKAPARTHDLLELFDGLDPSTQAMLEERMGAVEPYSIEHRLEGKRSWEPLRKLLSSHKNTFIDWRYIHQYEGGVVETASLDRALTVIIDAYYKRWGDSDTTN